jgi:three-Cys-motif partner protein
LPREKTDDFEWWQKRINDIKGLEKEADQLYNRTGVAYEIGPQAICKLALFAYYIDVYTSILKSNAPKIYYVDLFAGSGLTKIDSTGDLVLGSAMLAKKIPKPGKEFDKMFLVENDPVKVEALGKLLPEATIIPKDVNTVDWSSEIGNDDAAYLVIADPEGMQMDWRTIEPLLRRWSDVVINFQAEGPMRVGGRALTEPEYAPAMDRFYGNQNWRSARNTSGDAWLEIYIKQLEAHKPIAKWAKVRGRGSFYYDLIVAVKKTAGTKGGEQDWLKAIDRVNDHVERAKPDLIERLLHVYHGRVKTLEDSW